MLSNISRCTTNDLAPPPLETLALQLGQYSVLSDNVLAVGALMYHNTTFPTLDEIPLTFLSYVEPVQLVVELLWTRDWSAVGDIEQNVWARPLARAACPNLDLPNIFPTELTAVLYEEVPGTDTVG